MPSLPDDHPESYADALKSPPPADYREPESDFELEDNALLGSSGGPLSSRSKWRVNGTRALGNTRRLIASTSFGQRVEQKYKIIADRLPKRTFTYFLILLLLLIVIWAIKNGSGTSHTYLLPKNPFCNFAESTTVFAKKPTGMKIYGLVFYGRKRTIEILDCYLQKNLVKNGGWLDEIHFLINTPVQEDLDWIAEKLPQVPEYKGIYMAEGTDMRDFESVWRQGLQHSHDDLYVKFDDDLVWLSDNAVEELVTSLLLHKESYIVLANLVNSAALGWLHFRSGAVLSYLPERTQPGEVSDGWGPHAWRESKLPTHSDFSDSHPFFNSDDDFDNPATYPNHRWLPLRDNQSYMPLTPIWRTEYNPNSFDWNHWQLGAQQHYSLFSHLESYVSGDDTNAFSSYHFGDSKSGLWNMRFLHANINLMAVWANDILQHLPFTEDLDDEAYFSIVAPRNEKRQVYIQTRALAAHFAFGPQGNMYSTDLLGRYRAFANEGVCKDMGIKLEPREEWQQA